MNSRDKGARGEVQVIHLLRTIGIDAWSTRSVQAASARKWDIDWTGCTWAVEVKIGKSWTLPASWRQAVKQAQGSGRKPVLIARRDRGPWEVWVENGNLFWWSSHWPKQIDGMELQWSVVQTWLEFVRMHEEAPKVCGDVSSEGPRPALVE